MPRKQKIVIVEDEGVIAADLEARLRTAGYSVPGTAASAQKALDLIEETSPDLVLMDIQLQGNEDGIQVADLVREKLDIPVVFLTAYSDPGTLERVSRTQAFGFINKPIATAALKGAIEVALSKHRYERSLRQEWEKAAAGLASLPYAVLVTDVLGRVTHMNSQAEELVGWRVDQALDRPVAELLRVFSRETGSPVEDLVPLALLRKETIPLPDGLALRGSQERIFTIEGSVAPVWRGGRLEGAVIALTDVTIDRFVEEQLRQNGKQAALVRMAEGVVRQLPDLSEMAQESARLLDSLPENSLLRESAKKIEKAARDAFATACYLRSFADSPEFHLERLTLNGVLERFGDVFEAVAPGVTLLVEPQPMPVQADECCLVTALVNVLLHARARRQPGTGLVLDVSSAEPEQLGPCFRVRITYATAHEDAAALDRAFEPSWSGPSEDLHVTHSLVRKMGGLASVRLENGDTVRFDIFLPRIEATCPVGPLAG